MAMYERKRYCFLRRGKTLAGFSRVNRDVATSIKRFHDDGPPYQR
jgi:hypothetical protein